MATRKDPGVILTEGMFSGNHQVYSLQTPEMGLAVVDQGRAALCPSFPEAADSRGAVQRAYKVFGAEVATFSQAWL